MTDWSLDRPSFIMKPFHPREILRKTSCEIYQTYICTTLDSGVFTCIPNLYEHSLGRRECVQSAMKNEFPIVRTQNKVRWILTVTLTDILKSWVFKILQQTATRLIVRCYSGLTWKITVRGVNNCLNYCEICIIYTHFTNVAAGHLIQI